MTCIIRQILTVGNFTPPHPHPREYWGPRSGQGPTQRVGGSGVFVHQLPSVMEQGALPGKVNLPALPACTAHRGNKMTPKKETLRKRCRCCHLEVGLLCNQQEQGQEQDTDGGTNLRAWQPLSSSDQEASYPGQLLSIFCKPSRDSKMSPSSSPLTSLQACQTFYLPYQVPPILALRKDSQSCHCQDSPLLKGSRMDKLILS